MSREYQFDTPEEFLSKWRELQSRGVRRQDVDMYYPHPVHGLENALDPAPSLLRFFTLTGALAGLTGGFAFTIYTVFSWPLITGGKPLVSIPAFIIVAFELTILLGAVISFGGFLLLSRLPDFSRFLDPLDYGNRFVIVLKNQPEGESQ